MTQIYFSKIFGQLNIKKKKLNSIENTLKANIYGINRAIASRVQAITGLKSFDNLSQKKISNNINETLLKQSIINSLIIEIDNNTKCSLSYLPRQKYINDINGSNDYTVSKNYLCKNEKLEYELRLEEYNNIKKEIYIKSHKGFCHKHGLPVNGQRTKTNRKTQRKSTSKRFIYPKKPIL